MGQASRIIVRPLARDEWQAFRAMRLHALASEPGVFASSVSRERDLSEEEWKSRIVQPGKQMFGAFDGARMIGISGVITALDDVSGTTAMMVASYVLPEFRGRGIARLFYEARLGWIRERSHFARVMVSHRASNERSRRANQRFGFLETVRIPTTWPDGGVEDEIVYELSLR